MLKLKAFSTAVPALLAADGAASSFDASAVVNSMMESATNQIYAILPGISLAVCGVTVAVVIVKFGNKWIKKLGNV